ncbi:hypothetical protein, partial [Mesorhizobium sp. B2-4-2]|uniref:hypothetical protein n=1 Tax=Mesorhizobium sp. B2-4-2 TaxID=2589947 RepID=UPI001AED6034
NPAIPKPQSARIKKPNQWLADSSRPTCYGTDIQSSESNLYALLGIASLLHFIFKLVDRLLFRRSRLAAGTAFRVLESSPTPAIERTIGFGGIEFIKTFRSC